MNMCADPSVAVRIRQRTLRHIADLNGGLEPEIEEKPTFFMIYCFGSDHEETAIIDKDTFDRTYGEMPAHLDIQQVTTID